MRMGWISKMIVLGVEAESNAPRGSVNVYI